MDTTRLRELVTTDGPFASVYFEDSHDTEDAAKQLELKWRELRSALAEQRTDDSTLDALETAINDGDAPVGRSGRALIAAGGRVLVDQELDEPPATTVSRRSDLPYLLPLAEFGERPPAHVVVVVDHTGAEITTVDHRGQIVDEHTTEGAKHPVHKVRAGGLAHRDLQARTEETVRHNLDLVADDVAKAVSGTGATLVIVAGELQARKGLQEALPDHVREHVTEVQSGGRHAGAGNEELHRQVGEVLAQEKRRRRDAEISRFSDAFGQNTGLGVQGLEATTTALREGNVEVLLMGRPGDALVLVGSQPTQLGVQRDELEAYGESRIEPRRVDEALPAAAVATKASLLHVGDEIELTEGVGAVLRHE